MSRLTKPAKILVTAFIIVLLLLIIIVIIAVNKSKEYQKDKAERAEQEETTSDIPFTTLDDIAAIPGTEQKPEEVSGDIIDITQFEGKELDPDDYVIDPAPLNDLMYKSGYSGTFEYYVVSYTDQQVNIMVKNSDIMILTRDNKTYFFADSPAPNFYNTDILTEDQVGALEAFTTDNEDGYMFATIVESDDKSVTFEDVKSLKTYTYTWEEIYKYADDLMSE